MLRAIMLSFALLVAVPALADSTSPLGINVEATEPGEWTADFQLDKCKFTTVGRNEWFSLEPGYQLTLESADERLQITVLEDTVQIGKVWTRVVEEREWESGELEEVSRNFFAMCAETRDIFYFGEDVDNDEEGQVVSHSSAWRAYEGDARPGMIMPGKPAISQAYYMEYAPGKAMDRAKVVSLSDSLSTPAGSFKNCLKVEESSGLNPKEREFKVYAPGIGLIQDEDLLLVMHGFLTK